MSHDEIASALLALNKTLDIIALALFWIALCATLAVIFK